jgi:hypothetical protein
MVRIAFLVYERPNRSSTYLDLLSDMFEIGDSTVLFLGAVRRNLNRKLQSAPTKKLPRLENLWDIDSSEMSSYLFSFLFFFLRKGGFPRSKQSLVKNCFEERGKMNRKLGEILDITDS